MAKVKPITACVKSAPPVPEELLAVARWMADEYMCLLIEALRALVPSGTKLESSTIVRVCATDGGCGRGGEDFRCSQGSLRLPRGMRRERAKRRDSFFIGDCRHHKTYICSYKGRFGRDGHYVGAAQGSSSDCKGVSFGQRGDRPASFGVKSCSGQSSAGSRYEGIRRGHRQNGGTKGLAIPRAELLERAGCSSSVVDALVRDGMLERMDVAIQRDPTAGLQIEKSVPPVLTDDQEHAVTG